MPGVRHRSAILVTALLAALAAGWSEAAEIRRYESKRLILHSDIDPAIARTLPPLLDQAWLAWEGYYGRPPGDTPDTPFRITGHVMADPDAFARAGLLPAPIERFLKGTHPGKHQGRQFWMKDQTSEYYRRHLMVHEATHCFMASGGDIRLPVWYLEGTAELFATHRLDPATRRASFAVMPSDEQQFPGWGRIGMLRRDVKRGRLPGFDRLAGLWKLQHERIETYAWSWAFTKFLDTHPRYQKRFRGLGDHLHDGRFTAELRRVFRDDWSRLNFEWRLAARHLVAGYDFERTVIQFHPAVPLPAKGSRTVVAADRGWQSTGIQLKAGRSYQLTAKGRFTLADKPKPWISEPDGISFRYHAGLPLGRLVCVLRPDDRTITRPPRVVSIGSKSRIRPKVAGTLFLRLNDFPSELADNKGGVSVSISRVDGGE